MSERIHTDRERDAAPPAEEETLPAPEAPVRDSGPGEGARGNREVPPAADEAAAGSEDDLEARLAAAEAEAGEHLAHLQRLAAEFDNFRKRTARDQESMLRRANERLVKELLPIVDDLERALEAADAHEAAEPPVRDSGPGEGVWGNREVPPAVARNEVGRSLLDGVRLVHRSLAGVLQKEGLDEIPTDGPFDPHVHEALLAQPSEAPEGTVIQVLQKGYRLGDHVLRPARVVVSAAAPQSEQPEE